MEIDVKSGGGIVARGADDATMSGQVLTLTHSAAGRARRPASTSRTAARRSTGTDGDDFLFGSAAGTRIDGGRGHDSNTALRLAAPLRATSLRIGGG